ncbi:MAG: hypothetical protein C0598_03530 [Marinilabiliales bacterium]|nr:MAG: hypothetical protein C0598_03530 [Marinilabiliales bacterium]
MKKIILILYLISLVYTGFTQEKNKGISLSLKTGITFANMYGPDVDSETFLNGSGPENFYANHPASSIFKAGFNIGLLADYRINKYLSLGIGGSYIQKGAKINATKHWISDAQTYEDVEGNIYWNQNFWTVEFPLTVYLPLKKDDIYFQGGLFTGFLINSKEEGNITMSQKDYKYVNDRRANKNESGFFLAAGFINSFPKIKGKLFIEINWSRSIKKSPGSDMIPNPQYYHNQTISLNLGYRYNI